MLFPDTIFLRLALCHNTLLVIIPGRAAHDSDREPRYALQSLLGNLKAFCVESFFFKILLIDSSIRAAHDNDRELRSSLQSLLVYLYFLNLVFWLQARTKWAISSHQWNYN